MALNLELNEVFNIANRSFLVEKKLVNLGKIWQKVVKKLEKVSQSRGLRFHSNKYDSLKPEKFATIARNPIF